MKKDIALIVVFVVIGILTRTAFHLGANIEFITALSITGGYFLKKKEFAFIIPLGSMAATDFFIRSSIIFLFTWSAFLAAPIFSKAVKEKKLIFIEISGIAFTIFFFLWTNFGVVIVSALYPKTVEGLIQSYINGIPFLLPQIIGNIILVPIIFYSTDIVLKLKLRMLPVQTL